MGSAWRISHKAGEISVRRGSRKAVDGQQYKKLRMRKGHSDSKNRCVAENNNNNKQAGLMCLPISISVK